MRSPRAITYASVLLGLALGLIAMVQGLPARIPPSWLGVPMVAFLLPAAVAVTDALLRNVSRRPVDPRSGVDGTPTSDAPPQFAISLSAAVTEVGPMEEIYLTGVYPGGEGAVVQVQRFESGKWEDFPVDASVSGETFSTYVQTAQLGVNKFRVRDTSGPDVSNEVKVKIR